MDTHISAGRPHMPGYHLAPDADGLLPWSWAVDHLERARNYWVATVAPGGRPHLMAVWGVWLDDRFCFNTSPASKKARNLAANPACTVATDRADEAVVVEGTAAAVTDGAVLAPFVEAYNRKYGWSFEVGAGGFYVLTPRVAFAFIEDEARFGATATRWTFASD